MAEITNEQQQTYPDDKIAQELVINVKKEDTARDTCLLYTSPSPRDQRGYRMPSSA